MSCPDKSLSSYNSFFSFTPLSVLLLVIISISLFSCKDDEQDVARQQGPLLIAHIESNYSSSRTQGQDLPFDCWLFLSDQEGNIIGEPKQVQDNSTLSWERPDHFSDDTFLLNRFEYIQLTNHNPVSNLYQVYTYSNFGLNEIYLLADDDSNLSEAAGEIRLSMEHELKNDREYHFHLSFPDYSRTFIRNNPPSPLEFNMQIFNSPEYGLFSYEYAQYDDGVTTREKFYLSEAFEAGEQYQVHSNDFKPMTRQSIAVDFAYEMGQIFTWGIPQDPEQKRISTDNIWWLSEAQQRIPDVFYAEEEFSAHTSQYQFIQGDARIIGRQSGKLSRIHEPGFSAKILQENIKDVKFRASGEFDVLMAIWSYEDPFGEELDQFTRFLYAPNDENANLVMPDIPQQLLDQYSTLGRHVLFTGVLEARDYHQAHSYQDVLSSWFRDRSSRQELHDYTSVSYTNNNEGGRAGKAGQKENALVPMEIGKALKAEKLNAGGLFAPGL